MKIIGRIGLSILAILVSLVILEFATRIVFNRNGMHYGIEMWKYAKQLKQRSPIPEMSHEHTPNKEAFLMGVHVRINSQGLRDYEHSLSKNENVYRILVLGDSMTFGWGVPLEHTYSKILEQMLNQDSSPQLTSGPHVLHEVINAGVGNYNTVQEVAYFKHRGISYNPDMVILGFYINDAEKIPKPSSGFIRKHSYFYVLLSSGWDAFLRKMNWRQGYRDYYLDLYSDDNGGWRDCQGAFKELINLCSERKIRLLIVIIPELHNPNDDYEFGEIHNLIRNIGIENNIPVIDTLYAFKDIKPGSLWVSPGDPHPNEKAHRIIAKEIERRVIGN